MVLSDEEAKTANTALTTIGKAGAYVAKILEEPLAELSGLVADNIRFKRAQNFITFQQKLQIKIEKLGLTDEFAPLSERALFPLVDAVSIEPDADLQDVWAAYVANAMDPDQPVVSLNRQLISVIRNLEPCDLMLFKRLTSDWSDKATAERLVLKDGDFETPLEGLEASMARLSGLGLFAFTSFNEAPWTIKRDAEEFLNVEICVEGRGRFRPTPLFGLLYRSVWGLKMERSSPSQTSEA